MKMKCRLCELSVSTTPKLGLGGGTACNHVVGDSPMTMSPSIGQFYHFAGFVPQIRDMMLAACLFRGYYQPAGPLITAHHGHSHPAPAPNGKSASLQTIEASPSPTPPPTTHQPPPSSTGTAESSDNEVIITSSSSGSDQVPVALPPPAQTYRYTTTSQYASAPAGTHPAPQGYSYAYPPSQYYHTAPGVFPQQQHFHHDICFPAGGYPPSYLHPKAYQTTYRRYLPPPAGTQYYPANPELYSAPPSTGQSSQVVSASSGTGGSSYQPPPTGPPPPTLVESYAAPPPPVPPTIVEPYPPPHYYTTYGGGPAPPACYSHSPPTRNLAFIDPSAYQSCPCPMQSCPKNVHTGPLTGDGKRSNVTSIAKESMPLPPVALALPLEPASVAGPPSPARGSAGMPPPPSPAGATYQPTPTVPKWDEPKPESSGTVLECKTSSTTEKRGKARLGKTMVRNTINSGLHCSQPPRGMLLMCHNQQSPPSQQTSLQTTNTEDVVVSNVKREVESPEELLSVPPGPLTLQVPPPPIIPQKLERIPELDETSHCNENISLNHQTIDAKMEPEVQKSVAEECKRRLSLDNVSTVNQNLETQDCNNEQSLPVVPIQSPVRRKSLLEDTDKQIEIPQPKIEDPESEPEKIETPPVLERTPLKRKLPEVISLSSTVTENGTSSNKKQKPSLKATKLANGSYKDLIKKNNNNIKFVKINNCKRKLISAELKTKPKIEASKTPKIALAKKKAAATKRKNNNNNNLTTEPALKKAKTSKPLVASNLHNLKQNIKQLKDKRDAISELLENKEPVRKLLQKKSVNLNNLKTKDVLNNVDRTIESVILNCATTCSAEDPLPLRTSAKQDSVLIKQVIDKQKSVAADVKPIAALPVATATTITDSAPKQQQNSISNSLTTSATSRTTHHHINAKAVKLGSGRSGAHKRKSKCNPGSDPLPIPRIPRRSLNFPRWSNGWSWEGDCFQGKVFINSDEPLVVRKCYPAMRHNSGDIISPRDCVLLKAGTRKIDLPFVAKVATLWEDDEGEMMMSLLWYYRPEHTDQGRRPIDQPDEVFASRHKDTNSVACIEDKCYVLTFNEYCRYRKTVRRLEENMEDPGQVVPLPEGGAYHREHRQPPAPIATAPDLVFFCRQVYDFRQKRIVKNPS